MTDTPEPYVENPDYVPTYLPGATINTGTPARGSHDLENTNPLIQASREDDLSRERVAELIVEHNARDFEMADPGYVPTTGVSASLGTAFDGLPSLKDPASGGAAVGAGHGDPEDTKPALGDGTFVHHDFTGDYEQPEPVAYTQGPVFSPDGHKEEVRATATHPTGQDFIGVPDQAVIATPNPPAETEVKTEDTKPKSGKVPTISELQKLAEANNVDLDGVTLKADIIEALTKAGVDVEGAE